MNKQTLINIKEETQQILDALTNDIEVRQDWSGLKVVDVRWSVGIDGDELYIVYIEECSPQQVELLEYLYKNSSFTDVEFILEW